MWVPDRRGPGAAAEVVVVEQQTVPAAHERVPVESAIDRGGEPG